MTKQTMNDLWAAQGVLTVPLADLAEEWQAERERIKAITEELRQRNAETQRMRYPQYYTIRWSSNAPTSITYVATNTNE